MNIEISSYRQRIGMFLSCSFVKTKSKPRSKKSPIYPEKSLRLLIFFVCFSILLFETCVRPDNYVEKSSSISVGTFTYYGRAIEKNYNYWVDHNFLARYKFGNKSKGGLKIMHWNAVGGLLKNKINEIENVVAQYRPHVIGISESYFLRNHDVSEIQISDYDVFLSKTLDNPNLEASRVAVYVQ